MTIEQYGHGAYGVRIARDDFVGTYRFPTLEEAIAFREKNGGRHFTMRGPSSEILGNLGADWHPQPQR